MHSPTILIVDDQPEGADLLAVVLQAEYPEATVVVTYGAHEALESAYRQRPDVAILDIEMPLMDGVQLAHALREIPQKTPLLVALSGNLLRLSELRHDGPFHHLFSKPADLDVLQKLIRPALTKARG